MLDQLVQQIRSLTASAWDLYKGEEGVDDAAADLNEGMAQALHQPTKEQAWAHIEKFMSAHKRTGASDTEARAVARRFLDQVDWSKPRPLYPLQWDGSVFVIVTGSASEEEDDAVQGIYQFSVAPADVDLADPLHCSATATAVLDSFHEHQGISMLDDFEIKLVLSDGRVIGEHEPHVVDLAGGAEHQGKVDPKDVPIPVRHRFEADAAPALSNVPSEVERG